MKSYNYTQKNLHFPPVWLVGPDNQNVPLRPRKVVAPVVRARLVHNSVSYCFLLAKFIHSLHQRHIYLEVNEFKLQGISYTQT